MKTWSESAMFAVTAALVMVWSVGSYVGDETPVPTAVEYGAMEVVRVEATRLEPFEPQYAAVPNARDERPARTLCRRGDTVGWSPGSASSEQRCIADTVTAGPKGARLG
jgi:hypothetical protein